MRQVINTEPIIDQEDEMCGLPLVDRAKLILKDRLKEDSLSYILDGKRVDTFTVIKAARLKLGRV